ncbi:MAG: inorganic phosphate transporter [Alphaproteobacteria bacterium]|nr:inorganic phosphate transporter [Alphaproteobacteria bacterium]
MGITGLVFLSSGLFLGWSLGANDAANIFGTAVSTRMVRFKTAAIVCSIFIALGAVISGVGAAHTLGSLGTVSAIAGSFTTALAAAFTVYSMIKCGLPVSVSQAVVGSIIGWNLFTDSVTDVNSVVKIASTWAACPLLSAIVAASIYMALNKTVRSAKVHLLRRDYCTRVAMILTGAFGAYSLGANNMANVVGVFVPVAPFVDFNFGSFSFSAIQQLFFVGSIATAIGVFTYSHKVMGTVGKGLMPLSPFAAWVVVVAQSLVLFMFASEGLEYFLASHHMPTIPLVPVSSTQAVVGAIIGIGLCKGAAKNIKWIVVGRIVCGWIITPIIAATICFFALFFMQNVFSQKVYTPKFYDLSEKVIQKISDSEKIPFHQLILLKGEKYNSGNEFIKAAKERVGKIDSAKQQRILNLAEKINVFIDLEKANKLDQNILTPEKIEHVKQLAGLKFSYRWELQDALVKISPDWSYKSESVLNKKYNKELSIQLKEVENLFSVCENKR